MATLMYHDIVDAGGDDASGFPGRDAAMYKVTAESFDAHLNAIHAAAADPVLTFDDGGVSALRAADALERAGLRGSFFVTTNYIGTRRFLDAAGMRELHRRGHAIGSHSCSHPLRIGHCSWARLLHEWRVSRATINDVLGVEVDTASVPGGGFTAAVAEAAAAAGFTTLYTSEPTSAVHNVTGVTVHGRYTVYRWTRPATAAALATGRSPACLQQALVWNLKKLGKRIGGERYLQMRQRIIGHGNDVQWGDSR